MKLKSFYLDARSISKEELLASQREFERDVQALAQAVAPAAQAWLQSMRPSELSDDEWQAFVRDEASLFAAHALAHWHETRFNAPAADKGDWARHACAAAAHACNWQDAQAPAAASAWLAGHAPAGKE